MFSNIPGWVKFLAVVIILAWLGLLPLTLHLLGQLADSLRSIGHQVAHQEGGLTGLRSMVYRR